MLLRRFIPVAFICVRLTLGKSHNMDLLRQFQNLSWCKPDWCFPSMSKETNELLKQCADLPKIEISDDIDDIIERSNSFPIPFPIETVRLATLKEERPTERLKQNIASTYPLLHERVLLLMTHFLIYKREFGSAIEKAFYKDMTIPEFIDRILKKRAINFMGPLDRWKLITGESDSGGWESIGTMNQKPPLVLANCLSYDEVKLAAMVFVSGYTECINDGNRRNRGVPQKDIEQHAVIIGVIGPRFQRIGRMDYEDVVITENQNCAENGYGEEVTPTTCLNVLKTTYVRNNLSAKHMWRQMWAEFYQVPSYTYEELAPYVQLGEKTPEQLYTDRYVRPGARSEEIFDNEVYYKRLCIIAETVLHEAEARAVEAGKDAFLNIIGAGLGVWKAASHQPDVYILTFIERIRGFLKKDLLSHVSDINFAFIKPCDSIMALFTSNDTEKSETSEKRIFFESKRHPKGGIRVQLEDRQPSARLTGPHEGKLLVLTYAWDGNAHPGNEFWVGSLDSSGDPAAACSTQVSELHNAHVNPSVASLSTRVAASGSLTTLHNYCRQVNT